MLQSLVKNDESLSRDSIGWNAIRRPLGIYSKHQRFIFMAKTGLFSRYCYIRFSRKAGHFLNCLGNAAR